MKIGLVTDIHNDVANLRLALERVDAWGVDRIVTLGDSCDVLVPGEDLAAVAELLEHYKVRGVWGNHDVTLCRDVPERYLSRFAGRTVLSYMETLQPSLTLGDYHFSHREPLGDLSDPGFLWSLSGDEVDLVGLATECFATHDARCFFVGHYHRWWAGSFTGQLPWDGSQTLRLDPDQPYFVVIAPVFQGFCALLDSTLGTLQPIRLDESPP